MTKTSIAVHGGAGRLAAKRLQGSSRKRFEQGLAEALRGGQRILLRGGSALNAVTEAVSILEDNEHFNAGKGAALCADGSVELSASLMRGSDLAVGAVVGLKRTKNPIQTTRKLINHAHGFLFGSGADQFAQSKNLEMVAPEYFMTPLRKRQWEKYRDKHEMVLDHSDEDAPHGTVGAVALDRRGNLAAATSTGGLVNQLPGRVGDSPVIGAGTWADNRNCAVSATGTGEAFARLAFARRVADLIELKSLDLINAADAALGEVASLNGTGGCIVLNRENQLVLPFNSSTMLRGWLDGNGPAHVAILPGEDIVA